MGEMDHVKKWDQIRKDGFFQRKRIKQCNSWYQFTSLYIKAWRKGYFEVDDMTWWHGKPEMKVKNSNILEVQNHDDRQINRTWGWYTEFWISLKDILNDISS